MRQYAPQCEGSRALVERMRASWRAEAQAAAHRLDAIGELFELRRAQRGEQADWAVDTWAAVGAEVAAAFRTSLGMAGSFMRYALAMRERLSRVAAVFRAGDIDYRLFQTMVFRTDLITDAAVLATVDAELAVRASRWPSMTQGLQAAEIDRVVATVTRMRCAVPASGPRAARWRSGKWGRGSRRSAAGCLAPMPPRSISAWTRWPPRCVRAIPAAVISAAPMRWGRWPPGPTGWGASAAAPSATADPRPAGPVVIHVIAEQASVEGRSATPAAMLVDGLEGLLPAEVIAELAKSARLMPLNPPAGPESGYTPSAKLADFVRCRDLTCRAPGCDRPAIGCDIDHTIPYAQGGATHASKPVFVGLEAASSESSDASAGFCPAHQAWAALPAARHRDGASRLIGAVETT